MDDRVSQKVHRLNLHRENPAWYKDPAQEHLLTKHHLRMYLSPMITVWKPNMANSARCSVLEREVRFGCLREVVME